MDIKGAIFKLVYHLFKRKVDGKAETEKNRCRTEQNIQPVIEREKNSTCRVTYMGNNAQSYEVADS